MTRTIRMKDIAGLKANTTTSPYATTEPAKIDGVRGGGGTPVDPPPSGDIDWISRLKRTGPGTSDPSFNIETDLTYLGGFRREHFTGVGDAQSREAQAIAFNPPEPGGRNGPNGSVFLGGPRGICELQIPSLVDSADYWDMTNATILQPWIKVVDRAPTKATTSGTGWCGWLKIIDGKLYSGWYAYYTFDTNETNLMIIDDPADLANSTLQGQMNMAGADKVVRYCADIPASLQASMGGTHFNGICLNLSVDSRVSFGHSVFSWNPSTIQPADTAVGTTQLLFYPLNNPITGYQRVNDNINNHYESIVTDDVNAFVAGNTAQAAGTIDYFPDWPSWGMSDYIDSIPAEQRETTFTKWALPDESIRTHLLNSMTQCGCAFIPDGSNTICFIGRNAGMRYGVGYKTRTIEGLLPVDGTGGWVNNAAYDLDNVYWTMNINDILNAQSSSDVQYSSFGVFDGNRNMTNFSNGKRGGEILSGDYDPSTGKLYLFQSRLPENQFEDQFVISVYQVSQGF